MKVTFVGAGPGAADLITLRGARALAEASIVLYAGSLVSRDMLTHCRPDAEIHDTAAMSLEEQVAQYRRAQLNGWDVARLHSGDPAIYGAISEQMSALDELNIPYEVVPGVSSFTASAAVLKTSLTRPEVSQTIIITRSEGRASAVPEGESLAALATHGASMAIFSGRMNKQGCALVSAAASPGATRTDFGGKTIRTGASNVGKSKAAPSPE